MPRISFTRNLRQHVNCDDAEVAGSTVGEALEQVLIERPRLRGYIVDEQGALRTHMVIFVDGEPIGDRDKLSDAVTADSEIFVMQALSGG